jgi:peptide/nickel transport system permease protein
MRRILEFMVRRLAAGVFTLLTMIAVIFVVYWAIPSQPTHFVYPSAQSLTAYQIAHADHLLGLDRPKIVQYADYVAHLVRGDLGGQWGGAQLVANTRLEEQPISSTLYPAIGITLSIVLGGALLVLLFAVPLGALAGSRVGSWSDRTISLVALIGICTHPMVLGLILGSAFGRLHWLPPSGYCPLFPDPNAPSVNGSCGGLYDWSTHLLLPWLTFALLFLALYTRMVRASVAETLDEDFVRTARAKGAGEARVLGRHVLPTSSLRVLTMVGMEIGTAIGVAVYIEAAFGIFGLGRLAVFAMGGTNAALDLPLTLAVVTAITVIVIVGNVIVDLLYAVLDPRTGPQPTRTRTKSLAGGVF